MKVKVFKVTACCGKEGTIFETDQPLTKNHLDALTKLGFTEHEHFTKAGILYATNMDFILTGPIGSNKLTVKSRSAGSLKKLNDLEDLLLQLG